jgi:polar amino acid transport system substrate-binding protein
LALPIILSLNFAAAETIVVAIEDKDWNPYYTWVDGQPHGPCVEIAAGAIRQMGAEFEFERYPWVRVLQSVERQKVDAGLCGTRNDERAAYSYYPEEPLLNYDATLFVLTDSPLQNSEISGLVGKSFGMVKGYAYGGVDDRLEAAGMVRIETANRESLLKLLTLGRVDTVLDSILPTVSAARAMSLSDRVRPIFPSLDETPGYLFFSRKPGHDALAKRFSDALKDFKTTEEFAAIRERYGL